MWAHLNNVISLNKIVNIPIESKVLNNFFTSVFSQASKLNSNLTDTVPNSF